MISDDPLQKIFIDGNRPLVSRELLRQLKAAHAERPIDLFFSYFYDACILPEAIDEIRAMNIKAVNHLINSRAHGSMTNGCEVKVDTGEYILV